MLCDGFLRNVNQMYYFLHQAATSKRDFVGIFYDLPQEVAIERVMKRSQEQHRQDDTLETITQRISLYETETLPVIQYLKQVGKLITIDANRGVDEIFEDTRSQLVGME